VDLLMCRNTLMYFNAETQERILARFHFALNDGGFLFLGNAETLLTHTNIFTPVDMKNRVFTKVSRGRLRDRALVFGTTGGDGPRVDVNGNGKLRDAAFEAGPIAQIVVDLAGSLSSVNERARNMFTVGLRDIGKPFRDLEVSYRPVELRSGMEQAMLQRRVIHHRDVPWASPTGDAIILDVRIAPLVVDTTEVLGTCISFEDVTLFKRLEGELVNFNQELETAYEEVQSTNEELQTTNEELQSTVEELETTNEELQSTNEELETMNEELQSTNEELETINEELRNRSDDLNQAKAFLESILAGLRDGVIVVDEELRILAWNHESEDLWGVRSDEALGKHLLNLDIGLPVEQLRGPIRTCLNSGEMQELELSALNRRGRQTACRIICTPIRGAAGEQNGVILLTMCKPLPR
jgi:two-component system CheB/CheR fusion protein